jgi:hypothetical protein
MGDNTRTDFQELRHFPEISWRLGKWMVSRTKQRAVRLRASQDQPAFKRRFVW